MAMPGEAQETRQHRAVWMGSGGTLGGSHVGAVDRLGHVLQQVAEAAEHEPEGREALLVDAAVLVPAGVNQRLHRGEPAPHPLDRLLEALAPATGGRGLGLKGRTFHDLRGTAVTRLAYAGCTVAEIATFTGLSLADVQAILDKHYLSCDPAIAESASQKLAKLAEARTTLQTGLQTDPDVPCKENGKSAVESGGWGTRIRT